ncbi:hypothetical protein OAJ20_04395 [Candidatus Pelagibacter sp.]|nr:hypothetical protein [Candidatus Pelagibacter sp.]
MLFLSQKKIILDFINHNKKFFKKKKSRSEILVEFNDFKNSHIPISYLSQILSTKYKSQIKAYFNYYLIVSSIQKSFLNNLKWFISKYFFLNNFSIYRSFGCVDIFKPIINKKIELKAIKDRDKLLKKIKDKESILNLFFDDIHVGDLIYDTYLKRFRKPTINFSDHTINKLVIDFYNLYQYWKEYFRKNKVKSVVGVHSPYAYGLILKIAIKRKIPTYVVSNRFIYKLNNEMMYMHGNFRNYKKKFRLLNKKTQNLGKQISKNRINLRLQGIAGAKTDLITSQVSSFNLRFKKRIIRNSKKLKILISPHDFFDAAHIWGNTLFSDFYDWLNYLGKISNKTNYDWYIKNRPNHPGKFKLYQPHTDRLIKKFVREHKNITLLPNNYPHNQIVSEGIDFVLTCHGSVAMEYANYKVPVINASTNNPHINYDFNINPKNLKSYKYIIKNLIKYKNFKNKIKLEDVYEYYFMRHIYSDKNWLIDNLSKMIKEIGGYDNQFNEKFYEYWINNFSLNKHHKTINNINNFIKSGDDSISIIHTDKVNNLKNYL